MICLSEICSCLNLHLSLSLKTCISFINFILNTFYHCSNSSFFLTSASSSKSNTINFIQNDILSFGLLNVLISVKKVLFSVYVHSYIHFEERYKANFSLFNFYSSLLRFSKYSSNSIYFLFMSDSWRIVLKMSFCIRINIILLSDF